MSIYQVTSPLIMGRTSWKEVFGISEGSVRIINAGKHTIHYEGVCIPIKVTQERGVFTVKIFMGQARGDKTRVIMDELGEDYPLSEAGSIFESEAYYTGENQIAFRIFSRNRRSSSRIQYNERKPNIYQTASYTSRPRRPPNKIVD